MIIDDADPRAVICTHRIATSLFDPMHLEGEDDQVLRGAATGRQVLVCALNGHPSSSGARVALTPWSAVMTGAPRSVQVPIRADMRAYILYTSGSTGRPKGVAHTHDSAMTFVNWAAGCLKLGSEDVVSQHASPSFDLSVFDFFATAMAAAKLALGSGVDVRSSCQDLPVHRGPRHHRLVLGPISLAQVGDLVFLGELEQSSLRRVVFAGETIPQAPLRTLVGHLPRGCIVSNWYGPTETNVCTFHDVTGTDIESDLPVPIGQPCPYAMIVVHAITRGKARCLTAGSCS